MSLDQELVELWRKTVLPADPAELDTELRRAGLVCPLKPALCRVTSDTASGSSTQTGFPILNERQTSGPCKHAATVDTLISFDMLR